MRILSKLATLGCAIALTFTYSAHAADAKQDAQFSDAQQAAIEKIVHDYLVKNPEILIETAKALEAKQAQAQEQALGDVVSYFRNESGIPYRGKKDAKHYVIEFFDYNCGYCKVVRPYTKKLADEEDVVFYYVDFPILSPISVRAAAIGLALAKENNDKYLKYQDYLMDKVKRVTSDDEIKAAVKAAGADFKKLEAALDKDPSLKQIITKNLELGQEIGVQGTPFFIVDGNVIRGAFRDYDALKGYLKN